MKPFFRHATLLLLFAGCANIEPPRGGPDDRSPPSVLATAPLADSVVPPFNAPVVFQFSERISQERIADAVAVSPRTSPVQVSHGRSSVRVSLRSGWEAGQIYHVTVNRTLRDLFGNSLAEPVTLVFSTGPAIPDTRVEGVVFDRLTGRPAVDARVEAIRAADSLVYATQSDSAGGFVLERFPIGEYRVRAYPDANRNRSLEAYESSDSTEVTIEAGDTVRVVLRVLPGDSTSAVITGVDVDSLRLDVEFDDYLDPEQEVAVAQVLVTHPGTGAVAIDSVRISPERAPVRTNEFLPTRMLEIFLSPDVVLDSSVEYGIRVTSIRNVNGLSGDAEDTFEPPQPPEPADVPAAAAPAAHGAAPESSRVAASAATLDFVARETPAPRGIPPPSTAPHRQA